MFKNIYTSNTKLQVL